MKIAGAPVKKPDAIRDAIRAMDDERLQTLITKLAHSTKSEQAALHFARGEQTRRRRNAKKAKALSHQTEETA